MVQIINTFACRIHQYGVYWTFHLRNVTEDVQLRLSRIFCVTFQSIWLLCGYWQYLWNVAYQDGNDASFGRVCSALCATVTCLQSDQVNVTRAKYCKMFCEQSGLTKQALSWLLFIILLLLFIIIFSDTGALSLILLHPYWIQYNRSLLYCYYFSSLLSYLRY